MKIDKFKRNCNWFIVAMLIVAAIHSFFYVVTQDGHNIAQIIVAVFAAGYFFTLHRPNVSAYVEADRSGNRGGGLLAIGLASAAGLYIMVSGMHPVIVILLSALFFISAAVFIFLLTVYEKLNMPDADDMEPLDNDEMVLANDALIGVKRGRRLDLLYIDRGNGREAIPVMTQLTYATIYDPFVKVSAEEDGYSGVLYCSMDQFKLLKERAPDDQQP
ncbi:hypothetical protein [Salisediminibacterium halotolerans]|uniref:hypothetical protein n=1 Tax=Salisediminibacterium halotolerans TaxID=517425 RepID=UPI000EAD3ACE|nr:hypothetical protein [Salisediminibacterium halotolerans]RLJ78202.1 hypothetical protein BCL39_0672 [Actinophytocola xinjiangensis]RPE88459.1 hypothetical protein EDD67_0787 [Salisediminibacterium halotolerans]TWG37179.1 hypothetical protein BCL52_0671 [Salisediminibacterium halotolerans]GEL09141.1 hypothetical protein SHA02_25570 [Salisediminibacterium halotolerans]